MYYTLLELFELIIQTRNEKEYYQQSCLLDVNDYLKSITDISDNMQKIISADSHHEPLNESINEIARRTVNVKGLLLYYYILHDDEFYFQRINNFDELNNIIVSKLENIFIGDLLVFENGRKKMFCVKKESEYIIYYCMNSRIELENITIEWF